MSNPCTSCAFREGSVTHDSEPHNRLKGMICASAGIPFYCHSGWGWQESDLVVLGGRFVSIGGEVDTSNVRICAGWKREVARLKKLGQFAVAADVRQVQKMLGGYACGALKRFLDAPDGEAKDAALERLKELTEMVMQRPEKGLNG